MNARLTIFLLLFVAACAPPTAPDHTATPQPTPTLLATAALTVFPAPDAAICPPAEFDQYTKVVLPLADEHTVDTYIAQKMEALTDNAEILTLKERAKVRLEALRGVRSPPCLQAAHSKMEESFEELSSAWDLIGARDYSAATRTLKQCYEALADAVAVIAIVQR